LFRQHAALASADIWPDQDGLVRHFDVRQDLKGVPIPTLPGWLLNAQQSATDGNLIDFSIDPSTIPRISFVDVLNGTFDPTRAAGKRVLIGATAVELGDEVSVPRHRLLPGTIVQALIAETLLQQRGIRTVAGWPVALLGALVALAISCLSKLEWRQGTTIAVASAVLVTGVALLLHLAGATSLHTSPILLSIMLCALASQLDGQVSMILAQRLALRRKDAVMGRLVDAVFDGIVVFDDQGKVLSWNRAAERMFGDPIELVRGKPLEALLPLLGHNSDSETAIGTDFVLRSELSRAIEQSELVLHYQPKFDVRSLQLVGLEALVRWLHPERGLLPPARFIPLAECTDLIQPLTDWVLNAAIHQQRLCQESGYDVSVAVNLSARSLRNPHLAHRFQAICQRWNVSPHRIICEITESSVIAEPKSASRVLMRLAKMGCKVSLDDFGTGYSSLVHLQALPIGELKINRCFVQSMSTDQNASTIVRTIVNLAHSLGMQVVAEGVEDRATFTRLTVIGCDQVQGHLFGRPVAVAELESLLRKHSRSSDPGDRADRCGTTVAEPLVARVGSLFRPQGAAARG
jgi:EAL domain-containing protein (putative c-di-GMP-specific phosphodiesterase class I)/PAS domain-containing protein